MSRYLKIKDFLNKSLIDDIAMIFLAVFSIFLLLVEMNAYLSPVQTRAIVILDISIALIFLIEWLVRFREAPNKGEFFKKNWWELLASIPIPSNFAQSLRALRVLRILRIIRLAVRLKRISNFSKTLTQHSYVMQILLVFLSITFIASILFDTFERGINPRIHTTWDSFWWAIATATTIGYGDIYPYTTAGRITSILLALLGLGALGLLTAKIATTLIKKENENSKK